MLNKAKKKIAILDINDINKKNESVKIRRGALSQDKYEKKYLPLNGFNKDIKLIISLKCPAPSLMCLLNSE